MKNYIRAVVCLVLFTVVGPSEASDWTTAYSFKNDAGQDILTAEYKSGSNTMGLHINWRVTNKSDSPLYNVGVGMKFYVFSDGTKKNASAEWCKNTLRPGESCVTMADSGPDKATLVSARLPGCLTFSISPDGRKYNTCNYLDTSGAKVEEREKKASAETAAEEDKGENAEEEDEGENAEKEDEVEEFKRKLREATKAAEEAKKRAEEIRASIDAQKESGSKDSVEPQPAAPTPEASQPAAPTPEDEAKAKADRDAKRLRERRISEYRRRFGKLNIAAVRRAVARINSPSFKSLTVIPIDDRECNRSSGYTLEGKYYDPEHQSVGLTSRYRVNMCVDHNGWMSDSFDDSFTAICRSPSITDHRYKAKDGGKLVEVRYGYNKPVIVREKDIHLLTPYFDDLCAALYYLTPAEIEKAATIDLPECSPCGCGKTC